MVTLPVVMLAAFVGVVCGESVAGSGGEDAREDGTSAGAVSVSENVLDVTGVPNVVRVRKVLTVDDDQYVKNVRCLKDVASVEDMPDVKNAAAESSRTAGSFGRGVGGGGVNGTLAGTGAAHGDSVVSVNGTGRTGTPDSARMRGGDGRPEVEAGDSEGGGEEGVVEDPEEAEGDFSRDRRAVRRLPSDATVKPPIRAGTVPIPFHPPHTHIHTRYTRIRTYALQIMFVNLGL